MIISIVQNALLLMMLIAGIRELKPMLKWVFERGGKNGKYKISKKRK